MLRPVLAALDLEKYMSYTEYTRINRDLVLDFFLVLSRMEFALKISGFTVPNTTEAKPNWDRFSDSIKNNYLEESNAQFIQAVSYYIENPPAKQVIKNGKLDWEYTALNNLSKIEIALLLVRRVRNNLFHGGKYNMQMNEETARNELLLNHGITIIRACLEYNQQVKSAYEGAAI